MFRRLICSIALLVCFEVPSFAADTSARPNIVLILIDDMGVMDVGRYGSTFHQTPNIDRLATQGMCFMQAYAACCVCSPTRAAILTGRAPPRTGITDWIPGHIRPKAKLKVPDIFNYLPHDEVTIADLLKPAGYTCASIGKWHLGGPEYYPEKHGFDLNIAGTDKGQPPTYFSPYHIATLIDGPPGEYLTDRMALEAEKFIEQNKDHPFFLYLPQFAVHMPIQAKKDVVAKYAAKLNNSPQKNPTYAAMVESVDDSVGHLMQKLDDLKLADRTIVIFTSDNGGLSGTNGNQNGPTSNLPLRAGKGTPYEGGVREPLIIRYPGVIQPGSTCQTPVISHDLFPTILEIAGVEPKLKNPIDGLSLVPLLKQTGPINRDALYWHYPHYHPGGATPNSSIRQADWKLIEFFEDNRAELYNLKDDPGEKTDLSAKFPDQVVALRKKLADWRLATGAKLPTPNPDYQPKAIGDSALKAELAKGE